MMLHDNRGDRCLQEFRSQASILPEKPASLKKTDSENQTVQSAPCTPHDFCRGKENSGSPTKPRTSLEDLSKKTEVLSNSGRRRRRKPLHPQKSPSLWDPDFRGVTLCFHTVVHGGSSDLIITPIFSKNLARLQRRHRRIRCSSESDPDGGHSTPEESPTNCDEQCLRGASVPNGAAVKSCASCATRRTPLWRDAEDGTPLCNACGIRYRKYRLRCSSCWHIPRKDNKVFPACSQCGSALRFSQARKC